jgi:hypothetical protein
MDKHPAAAAGGRRLLLPVVCQQYDKMKPLPDSIVDDAKAVMGAWTRRGFEVVTPADVVAHDGVWMSPNKAVLKEVLATMLCDLTEKDMLVVYVVGYGTDDSDGSDVQLPAWDGKLTRRGVWTADVVLGLCSIRDAQFIWCVRVCLQMAS